MDSYSNKVDMWALGVMFYRMLFGEYPYEPLKIHTWKFHVPDKSEITQDSISILKQLFQKDPVERSSCEQLYTHLM